MGVAVSKISMLTHCQALTQACNYCEGESRCSTVLFTVISLYCQGHQAVKKKKILIALHTLSINSDPAVFNIDDTCLEEDYDVYITPYSRFLLKSSWYGD